MLSRLVKRRQPNLQIVKCKLFQDDPTISTYEIKCKDNQDYAVPSTWPQCVDKLDCSTPHLDDWMIYDWSDATGKTPPFAIEYECKFPNKKIVSKKDLKKDDDSNLLDSLTINCQVNGTYDKDINDYECTKPCPFPSLPDPDLMSHDWTDNVTKPEIHQSLK